MRQAKKLAATDDDGRFATAGHPPEEVERGHKMLVKTLREVADESDPPQDGPLADLCFGRTNILRIFSMALAWVVREIHK